jgi:hypothetical protein
MVNKNNNGDNDNDDRRMTNSELFVEVGERLYTASEFLDQVAPVADRLTPEDTALLVSLSIALDTHLKALRNRYGVLGYEQ